MLSRVYSELVYAQVAHEAQQKYHLGVCAQIEILWFRDIKLTEIIQRSSNQVNVLESKLSELIQPLACSKVPTAYLKV